MSGQLLHIYGPFAIHSFGLTIACGILIFTFFAQRHTLRSRFMSVDTFKQLLLVGIACGIIGGRLLYALTEWSNFDAWWEIFYVWEGGFSVLGSVIGVVFLLPLYLKEHNVAVLPFFDLVALFAPLLQSISRLGCFFAGCCYGKATTLPWAITYTEPTALAPCNVSLHPTQLYSSLTLLGIFLCMYSFVQKKAKKPGQLLASYLLLVSAERFVVDFFRADREFSTLSATLSIHQLLALVIIVCALFALIVINHTQKASYESI